MDQPKQKRVDEGVWRSAFKIDRRGAPPAKIFKADMNFVRTYAKPLLSEKEFVDIVESNFLI